MHVVWCRHLDINRNADVTSAHLIILPFGLVPHPLDLFFILLAVRHLCISGYDIEVFISISVKLVNLKTVRSILARLELKEHLFLIRLNLIGSFLFELNIDLGNYEH